MRQAISAIEPTPSSLNLPIDPVERFILDGVTQRHQKVLGLPFVWTSNSDDDDHIQLVKKIFGNERVEYPYGAMSLASYTVSQQRGSITAAGRRGQICSVTTDKKRYYRFLYLPVDIDVNIKIVTNSLKSVVKLVNAITFGNSLGWFKFTTAYGGTSLDIGITPPTTIDFPPVTDDSVEAKEFRISYRTVVNGFISYPTLLEGQIVDTLEGVVELSSSGAFPSLDNTTVDDRSLHPITAGIWSVDLPMNPR